jgi:hypothetical protein
VYDAVACAGADRDESLIVFLPGTGASPSGVTTFVGWVGAASGLCVIAVPYDNADYVGQCCTTVPGNLDGPQDPICLARQLESRSTGKPATYECLDGPPHTTPEGMAIEPQVRTALTDLQRTLHLEEGKVRWDRIILTGQSQGAMFSSYIAAGRHTLAFAGPLAGGAMPTTGPDGYLPYVFGPPKTPVTRHRELHHVGDGDALRRARYQAMGVPPSNLRTVSSLNGSCATKAHGCIVYDGLTPISPNGAPEFLGDWLWALGLK